MYISALRDFNIYGRINNTYHCIEIMEDYSREWK